MTTTLLLVAVVPVGAVTESWSPGGDCCRRPDQPIVWCPRGYLRAGTPVRNVEHLSVFVSSLPEPVEWASSTGRLGRPAVVPDHALPHRLGCGAHDGTPDDFAKRVYRGSPGDYPKPAGRRPAFDFDSGGTPEQTMWTWLHGSLPDGCSRSMRHMISGVFDQAT